MEDAGQLDKVLAERDQTPDLRWIVLMRGMEPHPDPAVLTWEEFMAAGEEVPDADFAARLDGLRIGVPHEMLSEDVDAGVRELVEAAMRLEGAFAGPRVELLFDPQTSGGLLIAVGETEAEDLPSLGPQRFAEAVQGDHRRSAWGQHGVHCMSASHRAPTSSSLRAAMRITSPIALSIRPPSSGTLAFTLTSTR